MAKKNTATKKNTTAKKNTTSSSDHFAFLAPFGNYLTATNTVFEQPIAFKNHWQCAIILDALSRKNQHHLILNTTYPNKMQVAYLKALLYTAIDTMRTPLRQAEWIYLDLYPEEQASFMHAIDQIHSALLQNNTRYLIVVLRQETAWFFKSQTEIDQTRRHTLEAIWRHPRCRFIIMTHHKIEITQAVDPIYRDQFTFLTLAPAEEQDIIALLLHEKRELEKYHRVIIPDDLLAQAYALAKRYLSPQDIFEKTLLLLDSAAARSSTMNPSQSETTLTTTSLLNVLSAWTQIPITHLLFNPFKLQEFMQHMQQRVLGQEEALQIVGQQLQQTQANLQHHAGPICTMLFAGGKQVGKKTLGIALSEQLFKQTSLFYFAKISTHHKAFALSLSLSTLKFQCTTDHRYFTFKEILTQTPYAIVFIQDIELATTELLSSLQSIVETGFWHDLDSQYYDCRQMILLLSTSLGNTQILSRIQDHNQSLSLEEPSLLQLVLNTQENKAITHSGSCSFTTEEVIDIVRSELRATAQPSFIQSLPIVPFLPLSKSAIENIVRVKLKALEKTMITQHGIELGYATEVSRYIANKIIQKNDRAEANMEKALQPLYFLIEQAIMHRPQSVLDHTQLFLQLNETGQALRCDWLKSSETEIAFFADNQEIH